MGGGGVCSVTLLMQPSLHSSPPSSTYLFTAGSNSHGQLGLGDETYRTVPNRVEALNGHIIRQAACGGNMSAVVVDNGMVFTWGQGRAGQLGHGDRSNESIPRPLTALAGEHIRQISVGTRHMAAVTSDGRLFTWGDGMGGRLGHGDINDQCEPKQVLGLAGNRIVHVSCGGYHTAAVTAEHEVIVWGDSVSGRAGSEASTGLLTKMAGLQAKQVECGDGHTMALSVDGRVFTWGRDEYGQLGQGTRSLDAEHPNPVLGLRDKRVVAIAAGAFHSVALTEDGQVWTWGLNRDGALGHGTLSDTRSPKLVTALQSDKVVAIAAGGNHTAALTASGEVFMFGKGRDGQLGLNEVAYRWDPRRVPSLQNVVALTCGENHSAFVVEKNA